MKRYIKLISVILISGLGILVYSNTFHCAFHFDDIGCVVDNFAIRNVQNLQDIWRFYPCRFITFLSIAINYHFGQLDVFGYHVLNLAVHLISALLVWWLILLTLSTPMMTGETLEKSKGKKKSPPKSNQTLPIITPSPQDGIVAHKELIALFVALIFVSHPVQTEAVTYIWQRAASMAAMFYLASFCFYIKSRLMHLNNKQSVLDKSYYILSVVSAVLAIFTKEISITLPLMLLLYEFTFFNIKKNFNWKRLAPFFLSLVIIPVTIFLTESNRVQDIKNVAGGSAGISSIHYFWTQMRVMLTYIRLIFLPVNLNLDYDYPVFKSFFEIPVLFGFLFLTSILYLAIRLFSKYRLISFSIFWYFLSILPESSFLPLQDIVFEHRLYLPLVGYSLFLVSAMYYILGKRTIIGMLIVLTLIITFNSVLTFQRNKVWKDEFTLWSDAVVKSPHKARPLNNLGLFYAVQGKFDQAMLDFNRAIKVDPSYAEAYINRGNIYSQQGNYAEALLDYNKAIELHSDFAQVYNNRSFIYGKEGFLNQGLADCHKAIELNFYYPEAYNNCGGIHDKQGDFTQAILDYTKAIELRPNYKEAYLNRGNDYNNQGDYIQAQADYNKAIELDSNNAEGYNSRGNFENKQGNFDQAIVDYSKAIELNLKYTGAYYNRGSVYGRMKNLNQAILDLTKAIELDPKYAEAYDNRAVSYFMLKEYDKAWADVHKSQKLGSSLNPRFIRALKEASGSEL